MSAKNRSLASVLSETVTISGFYMTRRIIIASKSTGNANPGLLKLSEAYKSFKSKNPEKHARIPSELKQLAKDLHSSGVTFKQLAEATELSMPNIIRWTSTSEGKPKRQTTRDQMLAAGAPNSKLKAVYEDSSHSTAVEKLAQDYREFKAMNPEKTARIPLEMKVLVKDLLAKGLTYKQMAKTMGLAGPTLIRWVESLQKETKTKSIKSRPVKAPASSIDTPPEASVPKEAVEIESQDIAAARNVQKSQSQDWVTIRIGGREIEIAKRDFWHLVMSNSESKS